MPRTLLRSALVGAFCLAPAAALAETATAPLLDAQGAEVGVATFTEGPNGVLIEVQAEGLSEGWHGIHLHRVGDCSSEGFTSAGSHIDMHDSAHGLMNPDGPDEGDLPSLYATADGSARAQFFNWRVSLGVEDPDRTTLLDTDGSAIVIHAEPDDHITQPIGESGDRVACGVLQRD